MEACAMCNGPSTESVLIFSHVRERQRVNLAIPLCEACGNRMEKHIKRAVPKRLMEVSAVGSTPGPPRRGDFLAA
jgi:hypothetical protein